MNIEIEQTQTSDELGERKSSPEKTHPLTSKRKSVNSKLTGSSKRDQKVFTRPWLNEDGTLKSDDETKELGRNWSAQTWDQYLKADIGTIEDESLMFYFDMDTEAMLERAQVSELLEEHDIYEEIEPALLLAMLDLSAMERSIIKGAYWQGLCDQDLAIKLSSTYGSIRVLKSRAINKISKILPSKKFRKKLATLKRKGKLESIINEQKQWLYSGSLTLS